MSNWLVDKLIPSIMRSEVKKSSVPEGLWHKCPACEAVLARLREEGIPFISVLTDPVYGGVSASLAMLGDVIVGEPKALIGFAGPRVIEQTVREKLPEGFQRSEFLLEHGAIDLIISRGELRPRLARLLAQMTGQETPEQAREAAAVA